MKKTIVLFLALFAVTALSAQFVAKVKMKEWPAGLCDTNEVYALFKGFDGQVPPMTELNDKQIADLLEKEVKFLADNPKYKGKVTVSYVINCSGELLSCKLSNPSGNDELDKQVMEVLKRFTKWTPGVLNGKAVDCEEMIIVEIKKGQVTVY